MQTQTLKIDNALRNEYSKASSPITMQDLLFIEGMNFQCKNKECTA